MMGLKRKAVGETVKENKADELSSMFNMILDEKKKNLGMLQYLPSNVTFQNFRRHKNTILVFLLYAIFFTERERFLFLNFLVSFTTLKLLNIFHLECTEITSLGSFP